MYSQEQRPGEEVSFHDSYCSSTTAQSLMKSMSAIAAMKVLDSKKSSVPRNQFDYMLHSRRPEVMKM